LHPKKFVGLNFLCFFLSYPYGVEALGGALHYNIEGHYLLPRDFYNKDAPNFPNRFVIERGGTIF
jgi:hypothetical protein